jgi:hypothetical protein
MQGLFLLRNRETPFVSTSAPLLMKIRNKGQNKVQGKD